MKVVIFGVIAAIAYSGGALAMAGVNGMGLNLAGPNGTELNSSATVDLNSLRLMRATLRH
jgi:hypothetical protein